MSKSIDEHIQQLKTEPDSFKKARIIEYLYKERMLTLRQIATHLGKHPSYISHYLNLLHIPEIVLDGYYSKDISDAHLFILSRLKKKEDIMNAYEKVLAKGLSTAQTEELIRELKYDVETTPHMLSKKEIQELCAEIKNVFFGTDIKIIQSRIKGKIVLELKGDSKKTASFIRTIANKLTQKGSFEQTEDDMQVLE